ncbi:MAG: DegT/DnrJ/EryC1/StrS family aminotransferase [bacterium]
MTATAAGTVLLPAYIGWSAREGSGVFDPVRASGLPYRFYRMTRDLRIDVDSVVAMLTGDVRVLVLIHYFGWPDPAASYLAHEARRRGVHVLEDEAHALLTDVIGGAAGRSGDAAIYSLHKMLPVTSGGMLVWNDGNDLGATGEGSSTDVSLDTRFDLAALAGRRIGNDAHVRHLLQPLAGRVDPLWPTTPAGVVPQSFPVLLRHADRTQVYHAMNARGFGVVSLYHTMIREITLAEFPDSHWLAQRIMNLPIHPSVSDSGMRQLVDELDRLSHG